MIQELAGLLARETSVEVESTDSGGFRVPGRGKLDPELVQIWGWFGFEPKGRVFRWSGDDLSRQVLEARACYDAGYAEPSDFAVSPEVEFEQPERHPAGQRTLRPGSAGLDVQRLQQMLGQVQVGAVDGLFGPHTAAGVARFQIRQRLDPTGEVGPRTWSRLLGARPGPAGSRRVPSMDRDNVHWLRRTLRASGYGPIEPTWDPATAYWLPSEWFQNGALRHQVARQLHARAVGHGVYPDDPWPERLDRLN